MSSDPKADTAALTAASQDALLLTSRPVAFTSPPLVRNLSASSSLASAVRSASTTFAPASTRASAMAAPIPRAAPVTSATRPCKSNIFTFNPPEVARRQQYPDCAENLCHTFPGHNADMATGHSPRQLCYPIGD